MRNQGRDAEAAPPTIVFAGPTIDVTSARAILPDALYLPPARCGDVLRALRLEPRALLLIDGVYESTPAVWHKELLTAIEAGVSVFGAASIGALRAAELDSFGMVGIGAVYTEYREGRLRDDDEVAVVHTTHGEPLSQAMVDIRATVAGAVSAGVLAESAAARIIAAAKGIFYPERTLRAAVSMLPESDELRSFLEWVERSGGWVDLKRKDAAAALGLVHQYRHREAWPTPVVPRGCGVPRTSTLWVLQRDSDCRPIRGSESALPRTERVLQAARFCGAAFTDAKHLARLMAALYDVARGRGLCVEYDRNEAEDDPLENALYDDSSACTLWHAEMDTAAWAAENDCTALERDAFRRRVAAIERLEVIACEPPRDAARLLRWHLRGTLRQYLRWLDILAEVRGDRSGSNAGAAHDHRETRSRVAIAHLWRALDRLAQDAALVPAPSLLVGLLRHFGQQLNLPAESGADAFACWLGERHIDLSELGALLLAHYRFGAIAVEGQLIGLGVEPPADARVVWLLDALRLSGLYARAAALLDADDETRMQLAVLPTSLAQALARDFDNEEPALLRRELWALGAHR